MGFNSSATSRQDIDMFQKAKLEVRRLKDPRVKDYLFQAIHLANPLIEPW